MKMFLKQIKALLLEEYDDECSTNDILELEARRLMQKVLYKMSF